MLDDHCHSLYFFTSVERKTSLTHKKNRRNLQKCSFLRSLSISLEESADCRDPFATESTATKLQSTISYKTTSGRTKTNESSSYIKRIVVAYRLNFRGQILYGIDSEISSSRDQRKPWTCLLQVVATMRKREEQRIEPPSFRIISTSMKA